MPPIGNCPTWSYHGSKATIARWIVSHIPQKIHFYVEPFAGRANVFFRLITTPGYSITGGTLLNDKFNHEWYSSIIAYQGNWEFLPDVVNQSVFEKWRDHPQCVERTLIEPVVTYHSNRYNMNSAASSDVGSSFYSPNFAANWRKKYLLTQSLLRQHKPVITGLDYLEFFESIKDSLTPDCVIYCDPPYLAPYDEGRTYPNIQHIDLLDVVKTLPCKVLISNYENPLYLSQLANWRLEKKTRVSPAKGRQKGHAGGRTEKVECLWLNY